MFREGIAVTTLALAGLAVMGCGGAVDDDAARLPPASGSPQTATIDINAPSEHLYFGVTNHLHVAGDVLADVDLNVGANVQLEAATTDGSPIRFELWMVHNDKNVELINAFDVESGFVLTNIDDQTGDVRYFVHFPAPTSARDVVVHMDCMSTNGRCATELQPGETCLPGHACADGLVCAPSDGSCDAMFQGGTCVIPNDDSACANDTLAPACGCDGVTYANGCLAKASGAGVRTSGACGAVTPPS
jgi:hypothetical protein